MADTVSVGSAIKEVEQWQRFDVLQDTLKYSEYFGIDVVTTGKALLKSDYSPGMPIITLLDRLLEEFIVASSGETRTIISRSNESIKSIPTPGITFSTSCYFYAGSTSGGFYKEYADTIVDIYKIDKPFIEPLESSVLKIADIFETLEENIKEAEAKEREEEINNKKKQFSKFNNLLESINVDVKKGIFGF